MISNYEKLFIGASGGFALSILKLMQLNFYLDISKPATVLGGYLTVAGYVVLGTLVGFYFCEEHADKGKTRKSAFIMGLLAPSFLLAITTKPVSTKGVDIGDASQIQTIQGHGSIFDLLVPGAYAQTPEPSTSPTPSASPTASIKVIEQKDAAADFRTGVKSALGIQQPHEQAVYIVGKTIDQAVATKTAAEINKLLHKEGETQHFQALVIKPDSLAQFYVAVGDVTSPTNAVVNEKLAKDIALKAFQQETTPKEKETAKILSTGSVVSETSLFKQDR